MQTMPIDTVRVECFYRTTCSGCTFVAGFNVIAEKLDNGEVVGRYQFYNPEYRDREYAFSDSNEANELAGRVIRLGFVNDVNWGGWC